MMKTILVPVDFSEISMNAVHYAAAVAAHLKASILLLHTYHTSEVTLDPFENRKSKAESELKHESDLKMAAYVSSIQVAGAEASYLTEFGPLVEVMTDLVKERKVSLIIMGTAGAKGYLDLLFGTKAFRIIEMVNCPVITVPGECSYKGMDTIVFATDFHDNDVAIMKFLCRFASNFNASIRAVHVSGISGVSERDKDLLDKFRKDVEATVGYKNMAFELFNGDKVSEELENYILETGADLLVMSTHHRGPFDHLFESSRTRKIALRAHIPLLAFHYKDEPTYFF